MLFVLNNKYEAIFVMDNQIDGCPFFNDIHHARLENGYNTLTFSVPSNHELSEQIETEGYIVYKTNNDNYELFRIKRVTEQHGEVMVKTIFCEPASTHDLITKRVRPVTFLSENAETIITQMLAGSGWEIGEFQYNGIATIEFLDYPTVLDAIQTVISKFGLEIEFEVDFDGIKVKRKLINLYQKRGSNTNLFFQYGRNLMGVIREEHTNQLYTAMVTIGKEGVLLSNSTSPVETGFEIMGDTLVDHEAVAKWTLDGIHREGLYRNTEADTSEELYRTTLIELKKYNKPQFTYQVDVAVLEELLGFEYTYVSIGDEILIKDTTFPEPLYIQARILEKETSLTDQTRGNITLGEFVEIKVQPVVAVQNLQRKIALREDEWNQAVKDVEEANIAIGEIEQKVTYKVETHSTNGIAFKNGVISTQLYTVVYHGQDDITATLPNSAFIWKKYNKNGVLDEVWTNANVGIGELIEITGADLYEKASFTCEVVIDTKTVGMDGVTLFDVKDSLESGTPPVNPLVGQIWIDTSATPLPMIKSWNGASWESLGQLNADLSGELEEINQNLTNMTDDNLIDFRERVSIKNQINEIIGINIVDTEFNLPTVQELDDADQGGFATVRQSALNAGVSTGNSNYINVATEYNNLKIYLEGMTPVKVWDTSEPNRNQAIVINRTEFRDAFLRYSIAVNLLEMTISDQLKENADNIIVGGRNYIRNSQFKKFSPEGDLLDWSNVDAIWTVLESEDDKPNSSILHAVATGNISNVIYSAYSNKFPAKLGDIFTISIDLKVTNLAEWDVQKPFIIEFFDDIGTRVQYKDVVMEELEVELVDNTWTRIHQTITVTDNTVVQGGIRLALFKNGEMFIREPQAEKGNKMTDFMIAVEDFNEQIYLVESRVADAEQKINEDSITSTVMEAKVFQDFFATKADAEALGDYVDNNALDQAMNDAEKEMDKKIAGIDLTPFVTESDIEQTSKDITAKFTKSQGINLLRNSIFVQDFIEEVDADSGRYGWFRQGGTTNYPRISRIQTGEIEALGLNFNSGVKIEPVVNLGNISIDQYVTVIPNQAVTLSWYINKINISDPANFNGQIRIIFVENEIIQESVIYESDYVTNGFEKGTYTYTPTTNKLHVRIYAYPDVNAIVSGMMLNYGFDPFTWTLATGEMYNTNVKFDYDGIEVSNYENGVENQRTIMTPNRFAGFYDVDNSGDIDDSVGSADEVFRIDKDEFVQKKAVVREEITMGNLKVINMESPIFNGWVWVSNKKS